MWVLNFLEANIMNRRIISIVVVLTVFVGAFAAFAQDSEREESQLERRERFRNLSEAERQ